MSLSSSVALVTAGLAVAGGTSYVSLMQGDAGSRVPGAQRVLEQASVDQLSAYLDASIGSLQSTERTKSPTLRLASRDVTASVVPSLSFADRFAAVSRTIIARAGEAAAPTRSLAAPSVRAAALRMDNRAPEPTPPSYQLASYASSRDDSAATTPFTFRADIRVPPLRQAVTELVPMANAPFPYDSGASKSFFNAGNDGARGHRSFRGRVLWEKDAYSDPRVLLHIPKGFDITKPSVMVVFFHGHGATLSRDVLERQQVPEQITEAGANAVLVAPQLAFDAADSSPGKLWESGAFARLVREAGDQLTRLYGDPRVASTFANMPIIVVAYSGGYLSAASSLERGGLKNRVRGVVLLDALYGELDGFASWISRNRTGFFVSAYTRSTQRRNAELEKMLSERDVTFANALKPARLDGSVTFLRASDDIRHRDFVTHAWADRPIRDILNRLPEYRL
jgi:hypothetical protein